MPNAEFRIKLQAILPRMLMFNALMRFAIDFFDHKEEARQLSKSRHRLRLTFKLIGEDDKPLRSLFSKRILLWSSIFFSISVLTRIIACRFLAPVL